MPVFRGKTNVQWDESEGFIKIRRKADKATGYPGGGPQRVSTSVRTRFEELDVELTIDVNSIIEQLGPKLAVSKSGRSRYMSGAIVAKRKGRRLIKESSREVKTSLHYYPSQYELVEETA